MYFYFKKVKVYYYVKGSGSPTIFLHGWGGGTSSFKGVIDECCKNLMCINLDFPPFGKSQELSTPFTLDDYTNLVLKLLKKLNLQSVNVVAHSFGGRVAINLAYTTNIIKKMVLTGSAGLKPKKSLKKRWNIFKYKLTKFFVRLNLIGEGALTKFGSEDYKKLNAVGRATFVNIVNTHQNKMIKNITCPTLLFWGKTDRQTPMYMAKIFKNKIKDNFFVSVDGGHFAYIENFNLFVNYVNNFLKKEK